MQIIFQNKKESLNAVFQRLRYFLSYIIFPIMGILFQNSYKFSINNYQFKYYIHFFKFVFWHHAEYSW